ncbi:MAG: NUDIX hydrolase [candidate division WOR-3 bacterium]
MIRDRKYPKQPVVSVHAIIIRQDRILLVKRAHEPNKGFWSLPGGVVELGETIASAVKREIHEECNIMIRPGRIINVYDSIIKDPKGRIRFHFTIIYLLARYVAGRVKPGSDAGEIRWAKKFELKKLKMVPHTRNLLKEVLSQPIDDYC